MRTKLYYVTWAMLLVGAVSRTMAWQPASTIPAEDRLRICLLAYSVLLASYVILAAVAWFTRRLQQFSIILCVGSAANVTFGVYRDYHHFIYNDRSWYGGLDVLDAMGQIVVVVAGLLLVAFLYGLSSTLHKRA